ncbi:MAG: DUF2460 domain-containing protein [Aestuariivirga sp.]
MSFDEIRFPVAISRGGSGGPERRTEIVTTASGREERNTRWADSRRRYNAGFGVKSLDDIHAVVEFFEERRGRLHGFRWKDHADFKSCAPGAAIAAADQLLGVGDGVNAVFQLVKRYGSGLRDHVRVIAKPVAGSVLVAVDGTPTLNFALDATAGVVTFLPGSIPGVGAQVTAGFAFDVPVRFDTDQLSINLVHFAGGDIPEIPVVEVRL